MIFFYS